MSKGSNIPAHLVLGSLGSGKTTVILELLKTKPPGETWAVFVNELGRVSIDSELIKGSVPGDDRLLVHESAGGCICCSGALDLATGMKEIVSKYQPDRIIIEPTGLSDPRSLKDQVQQSSEQWGVYLASTIGVLDVRIVGHKRFHEMPFIRTLVSSCDIILGSKSDKVDTESVTRFHERLEDWTDHKQLLFLDRQKLAQCGWQSQRSSFPIQFLELKLADHVESHTPLGWKYPKNVKFRYTRLSRFLSDLVDDRKDLVRLKGIVHTTKGWQSVQSVHGDELVWQKVPPQMENRLLLILEGTHVSDLQSPAFSAQLKAIQVPQIPDFHPRSR